MFSSLNSSEFDEWLTDDTPATEREEQIAIYLFVNNNRFIHQLTQQENHVSHRGSIPSHAIIHRDRENAHRN